MNIMGIQEINNVIFEEGTSYVLIVDTNKSSFEFCQELCGYVTGINDNKEGERGYQEAQICLSQEPHFAAGLKAKFTHVLHVDFGLVCNINWITPGRRVDDSDVSFDITPDRTGYHAYDSVAVFLNEPPTREEMVIIRRRATEFCDENHIILRAVRVVKVVKITPSETELDL